MSAPHFVQVAMPSMGMTWMSACVSHGVLDDGIQEVKLSASTCFAIQFAQLLIWLQVRSAKRCTLGRDSSPSLLMKMVPQNLLSCSNKVRIAGVQPPAEAIRIHPKVVVERDKVPVEEGGYG